MRQDMSHEIKVIEVTAPACWACYLIYGDGSGLYDADIAEADAMVQDIMRETGAAWCVDCGDAEFMWHPDYGMAGDCCVYTFHV